MAILGKKLKEYHYPGQDVAKTARRFGYILKSQDDKKAVYSHPDGGNIEHNKENDTWKHSAGKNKKAGKGGTNLDKHLLTVHHPKGYHGEGRFSYNENRITNILEKYLGERVWPEKKKKEPEIGKIKVWPEKKKKEPEIGKIKVWK